MARVGGEIARGGGTVGLCFDKGDQSSNQGYGLAGISHLHIFCQEYFHYNKHAQEGLEGLVSMKRSRMTKSASFVY